MPTKPVVDTEIAPARIREALKAVLAAPAFRHSPQLSNFLSFVVEQTLEGKGAGLKAYAIATEALGRPSSFDPVTDATVRVLAGRVRSSLELHYLKNPRAADVIIELQPGSYIPQFRLQQAAKAAAAPKRQSGEVVIRPAQFNHAGNAEPAARSEMGRRLLILEDDPSMRGILHSVGLTAGFLVVDTALASEFWIAYRAMKPTHVILDLILPGADGLEIMRELGRLAAKCRVILISGVDPRLLRTSQRLGQEFGLDVAATISKPFEIEAVRSALESHQASAGDVSAAELAEAIERSELELHFQPKLALQPADASPIRGVEALMRWNHPDRGLLYPDSFITLAEESGLIIPLTYQLVEMAVAQLGALRASYPEASMAVNISASALEDPHLPDAIAGKLDAEGIPRDRFLIEISETTAATQRDGSIDQIARLRLKGFSLSIDDFGTGYSSLLRLLRMPVSEIKIDKCFVQDSLTNEEARLLVETVVRLCKSLNLKVCAEGVESADCMRLLCRLGCDYAQGYLFSRPVPAGEIAAVLRELEERVW